eukprot:82184_1
MQCQHKLSPCNASLGIKRALKQFNAILSDKTVTSSAALEKKANELIHNANVQLMNDFYHVKYDHNTNDNEQKLKVFCQFLSDGDNVLQCDFTHCQGARRYLERRHQTSSISMALEDTDSKESEVPAFSAFHILSRIHTYFIHQHDLSRLSDHERKYIEDNFKYIETETQFECVDADLMASVLRSNG